MRLPNSALLIVFACVPAAAHAQPANQPSKEAMTVPKGDCRSSAEEIRSCGEAWFKDCLNDWDSATHMSKQDYARTCRRVVENRVKALIDQNRSDRSDDGGKKKSAR
jgi:hypothetical protein